jgi:hypothetical protein
MRDRVLCDHQQAGSEPDPDREQDQRRFAGPEDPSE